MPIAIKHPNVFLSIKELVLFTGIFSMVIRVGVLLVKVVVLIEF